MTWSSATPVRRNFAKVFGVHTFKDAKPEKTMRTYKWQAQNGLVPIEWRSILNATLVSTLTPSQWGLACDISSKNPICFCFHLAHGRLASVRFVLRNRCFFELFYTTWNAKLQFWLQALLHLAENKYCSQRLKGPWKLSDEVSYFSNNCRGNGREQTALCWPGFVGEYVSKFAQQMKRCLSRFMHYLLHVPSIDACHCVLVKTYKRGVGAWP